MWASCSHLEGSLKLAMNAVHGLAGPVLPCMYGVRLAEAGGISAVKSGKLCGLLSMSEVCLSSVMASLDFHV